MNLIDRVRECLLSSKKELQAVTWPSREETLRYTGLVIGVSVAFGLFFGLLDFGLTRLVESTIQRQTTTVQTEAPTDNTSPLNPGDIQVETAPGSGGVTVTPITPTSTQ